LHGTGRWRDSAPFLAELIRRFPDGADAARIKLAHICVVELNRPAKALELLADTDTQKLPPSQATLVTRITAKARQMQSEGVLELDTDGW
jgi:hypothetical protein